MANETSQERMRFSSEMHETFGKKVYKSTWGEDCQITDVDKKNIEKGEQLARMLDICVGVDNIITTKKGLKIFIAHRYRTDRKGYRDFSLRLTTTAEYGKMVEAEYYYLQRAIKTGVGSYPQIYSYGVGGLYSGLKFMLFLDTKELINATIDGRLVSTETKKMGTTSAIFFTREQVEPYAILIYEKKSTFYSITIEDTIKGPLYDDKWFL